MADPKVECPPEDVPQDLVCGLCGKRDGFVVESLRFEHLMHPRIDPIEIRDFGGICLDCTLKLNAVICKVINWASMGVTPSEALSNR